MYICNLISVLTSSISAGSQPLWTKWIQNKLNPTELNWTVLRGLWYGIIWNLLGSIQDKILTPRVYCTRIQGRYLIISLRTKWKFCYFNTKLGRDNTLNPVTETETLLHNSKDNGVKVVNIDASTNVNVMCTKFIHPNFHKRDLNSHDGKTHRFITSQKASSGFKFLWNTLKK